MKVYIYSLNPAGIRSKKPIVIVDADSLDHAEKVFDQMRFDKPGRYTRRDGSDYVGLEFVEERVDEVGSMILECLNA